VKGDDEEGAGGEDEGWAEGDGRRVLLLLFLLLTTSLEAVDDDLGLVLMRVLGVVLAGLVPAGDLAVLIVLAVLAAAGVLTSTVAVVGSHVARMFRFVSSDTAKSGIAFGTHLIAWTSHAPLRHRSTGSLFCFFCWLGPSLSLSLC
jgi:hypothetical protein